MSARRMENDAMHSQFESSEAQSTLLLQIADSWAVCTRTPVPIILARFSTRDEAVRWQWGHESRRAATAA